MYLLLALQLVSATPMIGNWSQIGVFETEKQCMNVAAVIEEKDKTTDWVGSLFCVPTREPGKKV
jgi:hypothetical protein